MSKLKVNKIESTNNKPLEIKGNVVFNGNVSITGNISGSGINNVIVISSTTIVNNTTINNVNIPLTSSLGENSVKQKGDSDFNDFGKNSTSLGDYNNANGDYSSTLGSYNITGSKQYDFIKVPNTNYLLILDENVVKDFPFGNGTPTTMDGIFYTSYTVSSITKTVIGGYTFKTSGCTKYFINSTWDQPYTVNHDPNNQIVDPPVTGIGGPFFYTDCCTGEKKIKFLSGNTNDLCPQYPGWFNPYPATGKCDYLCSSTPVTTIYESGFDYTVVIPIEDPNENTCCTTCTIISSITTTNLYQVDQYLNYDPYYSGCCCYNILNRGNGVVNFTYTDCGGTIVRDSINGLSIKKVCARANSSGTTANANFSFTKPRWWTKPIDILDFCPILSADTTNVSLSGCIVGDVYPHLNIHLGNCTAPLAPWATATDNLCYPPCGNLIATMVMPNFDVPWGNHNFSNGFPGLASSITEYFQINFRGYISVPITGPYQFRLCSDDGAIFTLPTENFVVNNDGCHIIQCAPIGTVTLVGGVVYPFTLEFYQGSPWALGLTLEWLVPGTNQFVIVPTTAFVCLNDSSCCDPNATCCKSYSLTDNGRATNFTYIDCITGRPVTGRTFGNRNFPTTVCSLAKPIVGNNVRVMQLGDCERNSNITSTSTLIGSFSSTTIESNCCEPMTGDCVTYRFTNNINVPASSVTDNNIFWYDCNGLCQSEKLAGYKNYVDICAIKNSATASSGIQISQINTGCCVYNFTKFKIIHSFLDQYNYPTNGVNSLFGQNPIGTLLVDNGVLYGTTLNGGVASYGTLFSCHTDGSNFEMLFEFPSTYISGAHPYSGLFKASNGLFYGTTIYSVMPNGSLGDGSLYSFNPLTKQTSILKFFLPLTGISPSCLVNTNGFYMAPIHSYAKLMEPSTTPGILYGISYESYYDAPHGGVYPSNIYKYDIAANKLYYLTDLYGQFNNNQLLGGSWAYTQLYEASPGVLYGTCSLGGTNSFVINGTPPIIALHGGVIFKFVISSSTYTVVHNFNQLNYEGENPVFSEWAVRNGILYGTTQGGGLNNAGTIFSFDPSAPVGTGFRKIFDFPGGVSLAGPSSIMFGPDGLLYGQSVTGGIYSAGNVCGSIFAYDLDNNIYYDILDCHGGPNEPCNPYGNFVQVNGKLYGTSSSGGQYNAEGTVFTFDLAKCSTGTTIHKKIINPNSKEIIYKKVISADANLLDNFNNKVSVKIKSLLTGITTSNGTLIIDDTVMMEDLPENNIYTLINIDPETTINSNSGKIVSNYFGKNANAQGLNTQAKGYTSHAEGMSTLADGNTSHAEGFMTNAFGEASHAGGISAKATHTGEFARSSGMFNSIGDAQYSIITAYGKLSGATINYLYVNGIDENIKINKNSISSIELELNGIVSEDTNNEAMVGKGFVFKGISYMIKNNADGELTITSLGSNRFVQGLESGVGSYDVNLVAGDVFDNWTEILISIAGTEESLTSNCLLKINMTQIKI